MDDGARVKLIEIARDLAVVGQAANVDAKTVATRFRTFYRHLSATVETDGTVDSAASGRLVETSKELEALK
jgi:hypothetical protein